MVHCDRIGLSSCAWPGSLSIRDRKTPRGIEFFSFYYPFNSQWPTRAKWKRILRASLSIHSFLFFPLNAHLSHLTRCNNNYFVSGRKKFIIISRARIFLYNLKIPRKGKRREGRREKREIFKGKRVGEERDYCYRGHLRN